MDVGAYLLLPIFFHGVYSVLLNDSTSLTRLLEMLIIMFSVMWKWRHRKCDCPSNNSGACCVWVNVVHCFVHQIPPLALTYRGMLEKYVDLKAVVCFSAGWILWWWTSACHSFVQQSIATRWDISFTYGCNKVNFLTPIVFVFGILGGQSSRKSQVNGTFLQAGTFPWGSFTLFYLLKKV